MIPFTCTPQYKLLLNTKFPSFVKLDSLLPPSKVFTLVPMPARASLEDTSGFQSVICFAKLPGFMLTSNLWTDAGLVNGAMGTVRAICYHGGGPPSLPVAVMVKFDKYWSSILHDKSVSVVPQRCTWIQGVVHGYKSLLGQSQYTRPRGLHWIKWLMSYHLNNRITCSLPKSRYLTSQMKELEWC